MKSILVLIKHLECLIEKAIQLDDDGIEYFEDLTIPACELNDLEEMVKTAKEEINSEKEHRMWELLLSKGNLPWIDVKNIEDIQKAKKQAKNIVDAWYEK